MGIGGKLSYSQTLRQDDRDPGAQSQSLGLSFRLHALERLLQARLLLVRQ
jgi:hypothetical protein